ncbi:MAG: hypothetical protein IKU14_07745, partial [Rhodocyclaceae bacterium]|nr:hypothetical protein [Rhodocyclaceae bacterium]
RFVREKSGALPGIWLLLCLIGFILVLIPSGAAKTMADGGNSLRMAFFVALIGAGVLAWAWGTLEERIANNTVPSLEQRATLLKALICAKRGEDRSEDVAPEDKDMKKLIEGVEKFEAWRKKFLAERQEKRLAAQKRTQQQS